MINTREFLTVCIVCSDSNPEIRITKFQAILEKKFSQVYTISSLDDERPNSVNVVLLHASDAEDLLSNLNIKYDEIFQFTSDGNPWAHDFGWHILRETRTNFEIRDTDIEELIEFITGCRWQPPSMCHEEGNILPSQAFGEQEIRTRRTIQIVKNRLLKFLSE